MVDTNVINWWNSYPTKKSKKRMKPRQENPRRDQDVFAILRLMRKDGDLQVAKKTWALKDPYFHISVKTIRRMRRWPLPGGTRWPVKRTMDALAAAYGHEFKLMPKLD